MNIKHYLLISAFLTTYGCVGASSKDKKDDIVSIKPDTPVIAEQCLASQPKDIKMWLNAMPGSSTNKRSSLNTAFTVTTGTPGYKFALRVNRVMESYPEQVILDLIVTRPTGIVIQVVTENKLNLSINGFPGSAGSSVQVNCGGKKFFKIDKVTAAY